MNRAGRERKRRRATQHRRGQRAKLREAIASSGGVTGSIEKPMLERGYEWYISPLTGRGRWRPIPRYRRPMPTEGAK